ncbi:MAG: enoyl-CoA hydratase-related protein [Chloroflexota bacterium]
MEFKTILYELDEEVPQIAWVTLNRPSQNNAVSIGAEEMTGEIKRAMERVNEEDVKVAIFRSNGRNFSAGFDLKMVYRVYGGSPGVRPSQRKRLITDDSQLFGFVRAILSCTKVTMAQVHGWCIEAGMWIPECCDIAIAAESAKFAHRGQRLAFGGMPLTPLEMLGGHAKKIRELLITGRAIAAREAESCGIITRAVPDADLESEVRALARAICVLPRDAIVMGKMCTRQTLDSVGFLNPDASVVYHTLGTNIKYEQDEEELMFIKGREEMGARSAFHRHHELFEAALDRTKYFRSVR